MYGPDPHRTRRRWCPVLSAVDILNVVHTEAAPLRPVPEIELGHIYWPSDPLTRESSDPETQLTWWPFSIMNSKCRLMCEEVFSGQRILIIIGKSKSSLHWLTSSDFSPTTDTWQWLLSFQHFKCNFWEFFSKTGKTRVSQRVKWWPGDPDVKDDPLTRWPNDPVSCRCRLTGGCSHRGRTGNETWSHRYTCAARWPLENNRIIWWAQVLRTEI